ncbi:hypothetical protein N656DRAFT_778560 [Canariomyces notabilis]|uniref:Uncharacterized protein n=1 Tax=Canariomyces notabilis TaxID=2074819 RepID=A0AAN6TEP4_9PEZI|nr:hypothetical protein N656DRAFT_778560 [Canariomyces arenarius]
MWVHTGAQLDLNQATTSYNTLNVVAGMLTLSMMTYILASGCIGHACQLMSTTTPLPTWYM